MKFLLGFLEYENLELSPANLEYLDSPEKDKLNQFTNRLLKRQFLGGRILAKSLLSTQLNIEIRNVRIEIHPSGRPISTAAFSLSHSSGLTACITGEEFLGLDLERRSQRKHYMSIAKDFFHEQELAQIEFENKSLQLFYEYWTIKEAYIKANNMSVWNLKMVPSAKLSNKPGPKITQGNLNVVTSDYNHSPIEAISYMLSNEYFLAIASSPAPREIVINPDFPLPERFNLNEAKHYIFDLLQPLSDVKGSKTSTQSPPNA